LSFKSVARMSKVQPAAFFRFLPAETWQRIGSSPVEQPALHRWSRLNPWRSWLSESGEESRCAAPPTGRAAKHVGLPNGDFVQQQPQLGFRLPRTVRCSRYSAGVLHVPRSCAARNANQQVQFLFRLVNARDLVDHVADLQVRGIAQILAPDSVFDFADFALARSAMSFPQRGGGRRSERPTEATRRTISWPISGRGRSCPPPPRRPPRPAFPIPPRRPHPARRSRRRLP